MYNFNITEYLEQEDIKQYNIDIENEQSNIFYYESWGGLKNIDYMDIDLKIKTGDDAY